MNINFRAVTNKLDFFQSRKGIGIKLEFIIPNSELNKVNEDLVKLMEKYVMVEVSIGTETNALA